jgi:hypothetical protein
MWNDNPIPSERGDDTVPGNALGEAMRGLAGAPRPEYHVAHSSRRGREEPGVTGTERRTTLAAAVCINILYFLSSAYITCTNDGSTFALTSALVEEQSVEISRFFDYTKRIDYATKGGRLFSDRVPGTAFLAVPFYAFGKAVETSGFGPSLSSYPNIKEVFVIFLPNLAGTVGFVLFLLALRHVGFGFDVALLTAVAFALGSTAWLESTHLFTHVHSMAATLAAVLVALKLDDVKRQPWRTASVGFLLGWSAIIELQNVLFLLPFGWYFLQSRKVRLKELDTPDGWRVAGLFAMAFAVPYTLFLLYNQAAFGELLVKNSAYNPRFPEERSLMTALAGDPLAGLRYLFFLGTTNRDAWWNLKAGSLNQMPGCVVISPVLVLAPWGFYRLLREQPATGCLFVAMILIDVAVAAFHRTVHSRHIFTVLPLLFMPTAYAIERAMRRPGTPRVPAWGRYGFPALVGILLAIGFVRGFYATISYFGHHYFDDLFMFRREWPSYVVFHGCLLVVAALASSVWRFLLSWARRPHRAQS